MVRAVTLWGSVLAALSAGEAVAAPAAWRALDADGVVTIFGAVHALPKDMAWDDSDLVAAVRDADAVYVETRTGPDVVNLLRPLVASRGVYTKPESLADHLSPDQFALLTAQITQYGLNPDQVVFQKPWLAALTLSAARSKKQGWRRSNGLDSRMVALAQAHNKLVRELEDPLDVIGALADLPDTAAIAYLDDVLTREAADVARTQRLIEAWQAGDQAGIEEAAVAAIEAENPDLHAALFTRRNASLADEIAQIIDAPGAAVVAIGAGHLVGDDGVIARLREMGYIVDGP